MPLKHNGFDHCQGIEAAFFWQVNIGFCKFQLKEDMSSLNQPPQSPFFPTTSRYFFLIFAFPGSAFPCLSRIFFVTTFPQSQSFLQSSLFLCLHLSPISTFHVSGVPILTLSLFFDFPYLIPRMKCSFEWM